MKKKLQKMKEDRSCFYFSKLKIFVSISKNILFGKIKKVNFVIKNLLMNYVGKQNLSKNKIFCTPVARKCNSFQIT